MKTLLAMIFPVIASAQTQNAEISEWIRHHFVDRSISEFTGTTLEDGRPCGLFLTWISGGEIIYLVVGNNDRSNNMNDYVGMPMRQAVMSSIDSRHIYAESRTHWGNDSTNNKIWVDLNEDGIPTKATGISDVKTMTCVVKGQGLHTPSS